jgi:hypothetical protein
MFLRRVCTSPQDVTTQKTNIDIFTDVRSLNLIRDNIPFLTHHFAYLDYCIYATEQNRLPYTKLHV